MEIGIGMLVCCFHSCNFIFLILFLVCAPFLGFSCYLIKGGVQILPRTVSKNWTSARCFQLVYVPDFGFILELETIKCIFNWNLSVGHKMVIGIRMSVSSFRTRHVLKGYSLNSFFIDKIKKNLFHVVTQSLYTHLSQLHFEVVPLRPWKQIKY